MSFIEGKVNFYQGANETPNSAAEQTQEGYDQTHMLEESIKNNIYTDERSNDKDIKEKDKYRLKASKVHFLDIQEKTINIKEYGNGEFDHMIKTLYIIQQNNNGAGDKYNELTKGDYKTDAIGKIFLNLIDFMKSKGLDRPKYRTGIYTNADFLYMVALGQALVIQKQKERKDYSADKVSTDFGDNILGYKSMSDFESMDFSSSIEMNPIEELAMLKEDIMKNNTQENIQEGGKEEKTGEKDPIEQAENIVEIRGFPKTKDIYKEGTDEYFFTQKDIEERGIINTEYLEIMYKSLNIGPDLPGIEDKEELKRFVGLLLQQTDKVVSQLREGIVIQSRYPIEDNPNEQGYIFEKTYDQENNHIVKISFTKEGITKILDPIAQEGEFGKFSKSVQINGKKEEIIINTWTPEMIKAYNTAVIQDRPIGDRQGKLKEKFIFEPTGISIEKIYTDRGETANTETILTGDKELFKNKEIETVKE